MRPMGAMELATKATRAWLRDAWIGLILIAFATVRLLMDDVTGWWWACVPLVVAGWFSLGATWAFSACDIDAGGDGRRPR